MSLKEAKLTPQERVRRCGLFFSMQLSRFIHVLFCLVPIGGNEVPKYHNAIAYLIDITYF